MTIPRIRIGNQTAFSASEPLMPLEFALAHRFDAFEWFNDKRHGWGWSQEDVDEAERRRLRETAERHDMAYSVHASCQASLCQPAGQADVLRTIDFARDIGARLVNIYYHGDRGPEPFVDALVPVLAHAHTAGVRVSIENSVFSSPDDFNRLFELLARKSGVESQCAGLCYDMGHANLCIATRNDYLHFLDWLADYVPVIHVHAHENWGDGDSHLPLFTGPAGEDDSGVRGMLARLHKRGFSGAIIFEQWPSPPDLLVQARNRLNYLWGEVES